ncbi:FtsX-like permease family protein [Sphingobacterium sp. HJSM2_6]|uniref:ABC transporter permease n=1 Tax=Sphingobacterium sp. HJSM2_6 TaxID=3366264 RepID=UPI003BD5214E
MQNPLKLLWRKTIKEKLFTVLNLLGLTLGFSGFILSYQYIIRENSYDSWNPNYKNIYRIGLNLKGEFSTETPANLAPSLQHSIPEITLAGRTMVYPYGGYPLFGDNTIFLKNTIVVDPAAAQIFQIKTKKGAIISLRNNQDASFLNEDLAKRLFPNKDLNSSLPIQVPILAKQAGMMQQINDVLAPRPLSYISSHFIVLRQLSEEDPYSFQTFIQLKEGINLALVKAKIDKIYSQEISQQSNNQHSAFKEAQIVLEPLSQIHLRPLGGTNTNYILVWALGLFSILILSLAAVNYTNMILSQAQTRLKELSIRKILGSSRKQLIGQILLEVFLTCFLAALLSIIALSLSGNILKKWFNDDLLYRLFHINTVIQLLGASLFTALIAGLYPAIQLSARKNFGISTIRNKSRLFHKTFQQGLLGFQLIIALIFISGVLLIREQLDFMQHTEKGFEPAQVITFKGIGFYFDHKIDGTYADFKQRLINDPAIRSASSASNVPGSIEIPPKKHFKHLNSILEMDHTGIDPNYFETLGLSTIKGETTISTTLLKQDSSRHYAVINESAAKALQINPIIGAKIKGCGVDLEVIGVVRDALSYGFENQVAPSIYTFQEECMEGRNKISLMVKTEPGKINNAIAAVQREWDKNPFSESLPLDYEYMDQQYEINYMKQQNLLGALNGFTVLTVLIAALGLFSMSANQANERSKEMSIRKVLGASSQEIFFQLNKPFIKVYLIGSILSFPLAYVSFTRWLENFTLHIDSHIFFFLFLWSNFAILIIMLLSISIQSIKAARINPVKTLRNE